LNPAGVSSPRAQASRASRRNRGRSRLPTCSTRASTVTTPSVPHHEMLLAPHSRNGPGSAGVTLRQQAPAARRARRGRPRRQSAHRLRPDPRNRRKPVDRRIRQDPGPPQAGRNEVPHQGSPARRRRHVRNRWQARQIRQGGCRGGAPRHPEPVLPRECPNTANPPRVVPVMTPARRRAAQLTLAALCSSGWSRSQERRVPRHLPVGASWVAARKPAASDGIAR